MNFERLIKYSITGLITAVLYFSLYFFIKYGLKWVDYLANVFAYSVAIFIQYTLQSKFTFGDVKKTNRTLTKFLVVTLSGYLFSLFVTSYLVPEHFISELIGIFLVIVLLPITNLIFMFLWVFYSKNTVINVKQRECMEYKHKYDEDFYSYIEKGSTSSAKAIVPILIKNIKFNRLIDIGCGRGAWLKVFKEKGIQEIVGVDGEYVSPDNLLIKKEEFLSHNLSTHLRVEPKFDLVMSLEVAEHVAEQFAEVFIDNLTNLGDIVLFSAAVKGQGGEFHVNEQAPVYWKEKFERRGFACFDYVRGCIKNDSSVMPWYRYNIFIYANQDGINRLSPDVLQTKIPESEVPKENYSLGWRLRLLIVRSLPPIVATFVAEVNSKLQLLMARLR